MQHPLPKGLNESEILAAVAPEKDADGIGRASLGDLVKDEANFVSCTPAGMVELLDRYNLPIAGKHAVVIGRSVILGKPLALLLLKPQCHCHDLPLQNTKSRGHHAAGRYFVRVCRQSRDDNR